MIEKTLIVCVCVCVRRVFKIKVITKRARAYAFPLEPETKRVLVAVVIAGVAVAAATGAVVRQHGQVTHTHSYARTIGNPHVASRSVYDTVAYSTSEHISHIACNSA